MKKAPSKTKSDTIDSWVLIQKVQLAPLTLSIQDINNSLLLSCYIKNQLSNKSLSSNQVITINVFGQPHNFQIISIVPNAKQKELTKVGAKTVIDIIQIDAKERQQKQQQTENINLYGLDEELKQIQQIINNSIFNKGKLKKLGLNRIKGILILGINGMGKSSIVKYIENKMKKQISFKVFQSFNMLSKYVSGSQEYIKKIFNEAKKSQPSIIIFQDLHLLFSKKKTENETILSALLTEMENIKEKEQIVVIGTSNLERELDNNIKRAGRFQKQIILELPKHTTRQNIIKGFLNRIPNEMNQTDIKEINMRLNGFSTGEIKQIIRESYLMDNSQLKKKNVLFVLKNFRPVGIKEILSQVPQTKWSDIGGYQQVKLEIRKVVEWPLQHPQAYKRLGIQPLKGILLYGPPGCSKTMMAKAIATESKLNFLSVKGSELFSKYVGESQKAVRNLFKRARSCSPCIIFFDEIDAIATQRSANTEVSERVLIQLLTEMDGIESLKQVTIVAATNRPQVLDEALMRPGRFDHLIYLPPPDREARKQIFKINLSRMTVEGNIEEISDKLAEITENYTGAEIGLICREGALRALSENINTDKISQQHFFDAKSKINNRLTPGSIEQYRGFKDRIKYGDEKKGLFG